MAPSPTGCSRRSSIQISFLSPSLVCQLQKNPQVSVSNRQPPMALHYGKLGQSFMLFIRRSDSLTSFLRLVEVLLVLYISRRFHRYQPKTPTADHPGARNVSERPRPPPLRHQREDGLIFLIDHERCAMRGRIMALPVFIVQVVSSTELARDRINLAAHMTAISTTSNP